MKITLEQIKQALDQKGLAVIKKSELAELTQDYKLFEYSSYEEYRATQIEYNKRKLDWVWADEKVLTAVSDRVEEEFLGYKNHDIYGVCHGARNGFEVEFLQKKFNRVFGTDISETAEQYPSMIQWDFHDQNPDWVDKFQFIYTNSLDQSWRPKDAVTVWLTQVQIGGLVFIEHTMGHSVSGASKMDPFGAKPQYMPYLLSTWLGHSASIEVIRTKKSNSKLDCWLFVIKRMK